MERLKKVPQEVKKSFLFWLAAISAGVFEMIVAVTETLSSDSGAGNSILIAVGIRTPAANDYFRQMKRVLA